MGTSFAVVVVAGATTAAVGIVVVVKVVVDFGGSAGLNRLNGFDIMMPGNMVMPGLVGVGFSIVVVVLGIGCKEKEVTTAASSTVVASGFDLEGDEDGEGPSMPGFCGRALDVVAGGPVSLVVTEATIDGMVTTVGGVVKASETVVATLSGMRTVVMN